MSAMKVRLTDRGRQVAKLLSSGFTLDEADRYVGGPERCDVTGNLCGTDTWAEGKSCECTSCQTWLKTRQSTFEFDR